MPRIRTLKPEHKQHRKVGPLSDREYRLWVGMLTEADDEGRLVADTAQLRALVFAYQPRVTVEDVSKALDAIARLGLARRYTVGGVPYASFPSWKDHQKISNPARSYLPAPEEDERTLEEDGRTLEEDERTLEDSRGLSTLPGGSEGSEGSEGREGKGSERIGRKGKESRSLALAYSPGFENFWTDYPNKSGKDKAAESWRKRNLEPIAEEVRAGLLRTMAHVTREGGKFIPLPATWLNQGRWQDEPPVNGTGSASRRGVNAAWAGKTEAKDVTL